MTVQDEDEELGNLVVGLRFNEKKVKRRIFIFGLASISILLSFLSFIEKVKTFEKDNFDRRTRINLHNCSYAAEWQPL